ncbi:hypothetical protein DVS28_a1286 [Euzebya pacifica]|uniref:Uncharacterized protein n=1 Tax=Euzebya pacifica TaxID=1608957 RepID=A0A346XUT9_9ACTN|nr:hypothetical protein DVS28_a1286 [Euzebya pacifica]
MPNRARGSGALRDRTANGPEVPGSVLPSPWRTARLCLEAARVSDTVRVSWMAVNRPCPHPLDRWSRAGPLTCTNANQERGDNCGQPVENFTRTALTCGNARVENKVAVD